MIQVLKKVILKFYILRNENLTEPCVEINWRIKSEVVKKSQIYDYLANKAFSGSQIHNLKKLLTQRKTEPKLNILINYGFNFDIKWKFFMKYL
jgi:hypothetical protein